MTTLVHGAAATAAVQAASEALFGKGDVTALDAGPSLDATGELPGGEVVGGDVGRPTPWWPSGWWSRATPPAGRSATGAPRSTTSSWPTPSSVLDRGGLPARPGGAAAAGPQVARRRPARGLTPWRAAARGRRARSPLTCGFVFRGGRPSTVLDVSPTGRNGHHRGDRQEPSRSRPVPRADAHRTASCSWRARASPQGIARRTGSSETGPAETCYSGTPRGEPSALDPPLPTGSAQDLTPKSEASNFEGLPRTPAERPVDGARPNLENSTACQKSMPITSSRGGSEPGHRSGEQSRRTKILWLTMNHLAIASCSCSVSETTLLMGSSFVVFGSRAKHQWRV